MELQTKKGIKFLIDDEDYELIKNINWCSYGKGYITGWCPKTKRNLKLHRLIMGVDDPKIYVDHKNRNTLDNRRNNLRLCSPSENQKNKKAYGSCKYLGVCVHVSKRRYTTKKGENKVSISKPKFLANIQVKDKKVHLGVFRDEIEAAKCYNEAAIKYHGEFANLNIFT